MGVGDFVTELVIFEVRIELSREFKLAVYFGDGKACGRHSHTPRVFCIATG